LSTEAFRALFGRYGRAVGRMLRTSLPDGYFHVSARGVAQRGQLFRDDDDRSTFVGLLTRSADAHRWTCHAYCLMGTHYHLVLETASDALSAGLQRLNWLYAMRFNTKYELFGAVFANRFSARVIESEEYLYEACSYVLLNPVKAGLCDRSDEWPWSFSRFGLAA
jgi:REP-associated tyrosine transposase